MCECKKIDESQRLTASLTFNEATDLSIDPSIYKNTTLSKLKRFITRGLWSWDEKSFVHSCSCGFSEHFLKSYKSLVHLIHIKVPPTHS